MLLIHLFNYFVIVFVCAILIHPKILMIGLALIFVPAALYIGGFILSLVCQILAAILESLLPGGKKKK